MHHGKATDEGQLDPQAGSRDRLPGEVTME